MFIGGLVTSSKGFALCRLEVSFYGSELKESSVYLDIIKKAFYRNKILKNNKTNLIDYECFYKATTKDYFEVLFKGEKKYGRTIFLEEIDKN